METYKRDAEGVWLVQLTPDSDEYVFKKSARGNWGYMNKAEEERKRLQKEEEERVYKIKIEDEADIMGVQVEGLVRHTRLKP